MSLPEIKIINAINSAIPMPLTIYATLRGIGRRMIASIVKKRGQKDKKSVAQMNTVKSLASSIFNYIIYFIIVTVTLSIFGVNVSSILAVAGVGGIAISFGAQTLVKDIMSGMFIWMEGTITAGDVVKINDLAGTVESIAIRTTSIACSRVLVETSS